MIQTLGVQKIVLIALLVALAGGLYFYSYMVLKPQIGQTNNQLRSVKGEFSTVKSNMDKLLEGLEKFDKYKDQFDRISKYGFFDTQDRVKLTTRIEAMQSESNLLNAFYNLNAAKEEENELAAEAGYKVINTEMNFSLEAVEDKDIYKFIHLLNYGFPGHVSIKEMKLDRDVEITRTLLQRLGNFEPVIIVRGTVKANLHTMVLDPSAAETAENGRGR